MNRIISLEGISGSGKTAVIAELMKTGLYYELTEIPTKYSRSSHLPKFSTKTAEAIKANDWFMEREVERCEEARKQSDKSPVLADRWFFSICALAYARNKIFGTQDLDDLQTKIKQLLSENKLFMPEIYIMHVPLEKAIARLQIRYDFNVQKMVSLNIYPEMLKWQQDYYVQLSKQFCFHVLDGKEDAKLLADYVNQTRL